LQSQNKRGAISEKAGSDFRFTKLKNLTREAKRKVLLRNRKSCNVAEGLWSWKQEAENRNAEEVEQRCEAENVGMRKQRAGGD